MFFFDKWMFMLHCVSKDIVSKTETHHIFQLLLLMLLLQSVLSHLLTVTELKVNNSFFLVFFLIVLTLAF